MTKKRYKSKPEILRENEIFLNTLASFRNKLDIAYNGIVMRYDNDQTGAIMRALKAMKETSDFIHATEIVYHVAWGKEKKEEKRKVK